MTRQMVQEMEGCTKDWGGRREGRVYGLGSIVFIAASGVGTVCGGWEGVHEVYFLRRVYTAFLQGHHKVFGSRVEEADKVEVRFRG